MQSFNSRSTAGKLAQRNAGELFTIEVVLEYSITVPTGQCSSEILIYIAAQHICGI